MATLFNIEQYQQIYKRDWDDVEYDPAWDERDKINEISHSEVSVVVEHSAVVEVLEEKVEISSDRWNPAHFGEIPRKVDADGNPTIFWDESIEPPEPDDFESLQEYEEAWHKWETENSDSLTCVVELEQVSPSQESSPKKLNSADSAKSIPFVKKDYSNDFLVSQSTTTLENSQAPKESTSLPRHHHANPLPLKESAWVQPISEIVSPQYCKSSAELNPNSSVLKTSPDCYRHPNTQEKNPAHISSRCSGSFASVGTMRSGWLWERDLNLEPDGKVKDSYSLPRPGALSKSSPSSRPPGNTKSEAKAKKLGLIGKNEVFNPEWLEQEFGLPIGWTEPLVCRAATELLERVEQPWEISSTPELQPSQSNEYSTSTPKASVKEKSGEYSTTKSNTVKAISLWQPWASLIPLGLKHYETRSWKTKYRGKLLICSTAKSTKTQYQYYLKICNELELPAWDEINFPHGRAIAICDLVDCIEMTPEFIAQQSQTEILCGDWQAGRYAWKLENIQPITEPFAVKGKQRLFNVSSTNFESYLKKKFTSTQVSKKDNKKSDCWYTPLHIVELVVQVLGAIDLDPCADDGEHIPATLHYTAADDGLIQEWSGKVYMNPPYSRPGVWIKKLQAEFELGRVTEAIALVPAATDTNWLSPVLKTQAVCFWKGRIKFLGEDYQPKNAARQSHVLVYWGKNWQRFKDVFEGYGFVSVPSQFLGDKLGGEISPRKMDKDNKFLGDKTEDRISPRKTSKNEKFLGDKLSGEISPRKIDKDNKFLGDKTKDKISPRKTSKNEKFLGDKLGGEISPRKIGNESEFLGDKLDEHISPRKTRRRKGDGSGSIHYRAVTKKGKEYREAYYHYEVWQDGDRLVKSSKYISKKLLSQVQRMEVEKAPVREILKVLGVVV